MVGTVTVACKIPNGLLLRIFDMVDYDEPVMGGGTKTMKRAVQVGGVVKIHGPAAPFGQTPAAPIAGGYALTPNVDADFFEAWVKANADHDAVKNGLIFSELKPEGTQRKAQDGVKIVSGLHPIVPDTDPRIPRANKVGKLETATRS